MNTKNILSGYSWFMIFRGIIAILFAIIAFTWPDLTFEALIFIFAFFVILDGLLAIISSFSSTKAHKKWWMFLFEGLVGIAAGIFILVYSQITALVLLYFLAVWAIATGIIEFILAILSDWDTGFKWCLGSTGILSIAIGILMFAFPGESIVILVWFLGIYAFVFGIAIIITGAKGLSITKKLESTTK